MKQNNFFEKIATRKVIFERTNEMYEKLNSLLTEVIGLDYSVSFAKVNEQSVKSDFHEPSEERKFVAKDRKF